VKEKSEGIQKEERKRENKIKKWEDRKNRPQLTLKKTMQTFGKCDAD
jgi:hypothetical protein